MELDLSDTHILFLWLITRNICCTFLTAIIWLCIPHPHILGLTHEYYDCPVGRHISVYPFISHPLFYLICRRYVFHDFHNLDVVFDAGGRVSLSLTTVTATAQLMWPADFLQSPTIASKVSVFKKIRSLLNRY